jgi:hypothetical protein
MSTKIQTGTRGTSAQNVAAPSRKSPVGASAPVANERDAYLPPPRRTGILWPSVEQMETLIERARAALSRGIIWDRGSIVNILL